MDVSENLLAQAAPLRVDTAKAADISRLLDLTGGKQMAFNIMRQFSPLIEQMAKQIADELLPPGERSRHFSDVFVQQWRARGVEELMELDHFYS